MSSLSKHFILNKTLIPAKIDDLKQIIPKSVLDMEDKNLYYSEYEYINRISPKTYTKNKFLDTFLASYNNHLPLVIRPDDIHLALQLIFCTAIELNAEKLRSFFVDFEGKRNLQIRMVDFNSDLMFELFRQEIKSNIKSPEFADNYIANYSTTNQIVSNASNGLLMNALKEYFTYTMILSCGIPEIILEGSVTDWEKLYNFYTYMKNIFFSQKITDLDIWFGYFDKIMEMFNELAHMESSDLSDTDYAKLWSRVITYVPYGSGGDKLLGGWVRLFFPFDTSKKVVIKSKQNTMNLDLEPELKSDYYRNQEILANFYMASGEESIPESTSKTKLDIIINETNYQSEFVSGFYEPHIDESNYIRFNTGTIIRHDSEILKSESKDKYIQMGVKTSDRHCIIIPYYLKSQTVKILDVFDVNCCNYYQSDKCIEKFNSDKEIYLKLGLTLSEDQKIIYIPRKYGIVYHYIIRDPSDGTKKDIYHRPKQCVNFIFDKETLARTFQIKSVTTYNIKLMEKPDPTYINDEFDIEFDRSKYKSISTTVYNKHNHSLKNQIKNENFGI